MIIDIFYIIIERHVRNQNWFLPVISGQKIDLFKRHRFSAAYRIGIIYISQKCSDELFMLVPRTIIHEYWFWMRGT